MRVTIRRGAAGDARTLGTLCYEAFRTIAEAHGFTPDLPDAASASTLLAALIGHPGFFDVVAEVDGRLVGSNFLDERSPIGGIGPITVDPAAQNGGVGRALMEAVMRRCAQQQHIGVRLVQAGYHRRSLALYAKLGFEVREMLVCLQGPPVRQAVAGCTVRPAAATDLAACNALCARVHGFARDGELSEAVARGIAYLVERAGHVSGYATPVAFFGHAVGETCDDLKALIGAAEGYPGPGFLVPAGSGELLRWCLNNGLHIRQTMTLMSIGLYQPPAGAWLPSVTY